MRKGRRLLKRRIRGNGTFLRSSVPIDVVFDAVIVTIVDNVLIIVITVVF